MVAQVGFDEAGDEVVAVVVAGVAVELQRVAPAASAGGQRGLRAELLGEEAVGLALVPTAAGARGAGDQLTGVPGAPGAAVVAQVAEKAFWPQGQSMGWAIGAKADTER